MAYMTVDMPDIFEDLALSTEDMRAIVENAAPVAQAEIKKEIQSVVSDPQISEVVASVKPYKTKVNKDGVTCFVGPSGKNKKNPDGTRRKTPVRNMEIAMYLNYGTTTMNARPWLDKALNNMDDKCAKKMQEEFDKRANL